MEQGKEMDWLYLLEQPAFLVTEGKVSHINQAAQRMLVEPGANIQELLVTGREEYADFTGGCLYLTLCLAGTTYRASVRRVSEGDLFLLEQGSSRGSLTAMALSARELRGPLSSLLSAYQQLITDRQHDDPKLDECEAKLNRSLFQLMRMVNNMSDAREYAQRSPRMETCNLTRLIGEIFEKTQTLLEQSGLTLRYRIPTYSLLTLADPDMLERAVYNMLSNAAKFSATGGVITATLSAAGRLISITVQDSGSGVPRNMQDTVFTRFQRQPGLLEDSRIGIGLGMALMRATATAHGGTILVGYPDSGGMFIKMTLCRSVKDTNMLRSDIVRMLPDYAGGWDHGLMELSDVLPAPAFREVLRRQK